PSFTTARQYKVLATLVKRSLLSHQRAVVDRGVRGRKSLHYCELNWEHDWAKAECRVRVYPNRRKIFDQVGRASINLYFAMAECIDGCPHANYDLSKKDRKEGWGGYIHARVRMDVTKLLCRWLLEESNDYFGGFGLRSPHKLLIHDINGDGEGVKMRKVGSPILGSRAGQ
ncbi:hypothetical protein Golax_019517, partial [Gossypium laxum]|nr:hypothetical protein [Gossypium laxum]